MIDASRVEAILQESLFQEDELNEERTGPKDGIEMVAVYGISINVGLHKERLETNRDEVRAMLQELPNEFRDATDGGGGGWSFLNMCQTKDGDQWTDFHKRMEELFLLANGLGMASFLTPKETWSILPGGVPYIVVRT